MFLPLCVCLFISIVYMSTYLSVCVNVHLSFRLFVCMIDRFLVCMFAYLLDWVFLCFFICSLDFFVYFYLRYACCVSHC